MSTERVPADLASPAQCTFFYLRRSKMARRRREIDPASGQQARGDRETVPSLKDVPDHDPIDGS